MTRTPTNTMTRTPTTIPGTATTHTIRIATKTILPTERAVLAQLGMPSHIPIQPRVKSLYDKAAGVANDLAAPAGITLEISKETFHDIFHGVEHNSSEAPLHLIYSKAKSITLFTLTIGEQICSHIQDLFSIGDAALGTMLDAWASVAANNCVSYLEKQIAKQRYPNDDNFAVLSYSPGYCGWHLSSQQQIFHLLRPETIGVTVNDSFLMSPVKSVSGALIGGEKDIHYFKPAFEFCRACKSRSCQARFQELRLTEIAWKS